MDLEGCAEVFTSRHCGVARIFEKGYRKTLQQWTLQIKTKHTVDSKKLEYGPGTNYAVFLLV